MRPIDSPLQPHAIEADLGALRLGTRVHYYYKLESTNSRARRLAEEGAREGEVVVAEAQTRGRGRLGREWVSPPYVNLYFSVILRPRFLPADAPQITLMAAVAVADTVASFVPFSPEIKWPNDILVHGKKLAGILTELSCERERILFAILGIGVNLNFAADVMPDAIRNHATSILMLTGEEVSREAFLRRLIQNLDRCYGELEESGFSAIAPRWEARFELRGRRVKAEMAGQFVVGVARGIDSGGALLVEDEGGRLQRIVAGDVISMKD